MFEAPLSPNSVTSDYGSPSSGYFDHLSPGLRKDFDTASTHSMPHGERSHVSSRTASFSSDASEHDRAHIEGYTAEELQYTRLKRIGAYSQSERQPDRSRPRDIVNKRLHINGTGPSRKSSVPVRPKSADKDTIRKVLDPVLSLFSFIENWYKYF